MGRFADLPLAGFLDALASPAPTPGGGTAAAVTGAMGASLLMMVSGLKKTRTNVDAERVALDESRAALVSVRERILALADADSQAFEAVMAAYRLPKATEDERAARSASVRRAIHGATETPLETLRAVVEGMTHSRIVAQCGNAAAASDVRVALELLEAAAAGAAANVEINIAELDDEGFKRSAAEEILTLTNRVTESAAAARAALS